MPRNIRENSVSFKSQCISRPSWLNKLYPNKEYAALFANKDRRESSGSDRLGELKTTVGAHFNAEEYQKNAGK